MTKIRILETKINEMSANYYYSQSTQPGYGLYRLYRIENKSIFEDEIEEFLEYLNKYLKKENTNLGAKDKTNNTVINNYYSYPLYPSMWLPLQPVNVINIGEKKDKKENEKEEKKEHSTIEKILLSLMFTIGSSFMVYNITCDYVEYKLYEDGKKKRKVCKDKMKKLKENNPLLVNRDIEDINILVDNFKKLYKSKKSHRRLNVMSKAGMAMLGLTEIIGGLYFGPKFYEGMNLCYFTLGFSSVLSLYLFNKFKYHLLTKIDDNEKINSLIETSEKLLKLEFPKQSPVNPNFYPD